MIVLDDSKDALEQLEDLFPDEITMDDGVVLRWNGETSSYIGKDSDGNEIEVIF